MGLKYLLVVRGDGGPNLPKLDPKSIGGGRNVATSPDLLRYINTRLLQNGRNSDFQRFLTVQP
jgi:hypothetical protein